MEKYLAMARDASATGDRVTAENYYQHAEHYYRLLNANAGQDRNPHRDGNGRPREDLDGPADSAQETHAQAQPQAQPHTQGDATAPADNGAERGHGPEAPNGAATVHAAEPAEPTGGAEPANGSEPTEGSEQHQV